MEEMYDEVSNLCSKVITSNYSTSFSLGIRLFDKDIQKAVYAIYGFVRLADEIVDTFHEYDKSYLLKKFEDDCFEAIRLRISLDPVLHSFQQTVNLYGIDVELVRVFLTSMEMDLNEKNHSVDSYDNYILGSAQVVGLMCLQIFTNGDKRLYEDLKLSAMKLGSAFQKINFLRDLKADYIVMGRTYFPGIDMNLFMDAEKKAIEADIHQDFLYAYEGITKLPPNASKGVELAYLYYYKLFLKIRKLNSDEILSRRVRISNFHKGLLMIRVLFKSI